MSLQREHKKSQPPLLDLAVFAGVLAFVAYSLHSFFSNRETPRPAPPPKLEIAENIAPPAVRNPASQAPTSASASTEVLHLPCLQSGPRAFTSSARLMQIHSPLCAEDSIPGTQWHASNNSSGEEILVFVNSKEKILSTSYFNLKEGLNDLVFVQDLGKGRSRREKIQITRKAD
ncbi:MAG: hypothetical protein ACXVB9_04205 [Bdellovibrionota bacterium]